MSTLARRGDHDRLAMTDGAVEVYGGLEVSESLQMLVPVGLRPEQECAYRDLVSEWDEDFKFLTPSARRSMATLARSAAAAYVKGSAFTEDAGPHERSLDRHYLTSVREMELIKTREDTCHEQVKEVLRDVATIFNDAVVRHVPEQFRQALVVAFMRPILTLMEGDE